jgi:hypothetical protein
VDPNIRAGTYVCWRVHMRIFNIHMLILGKPLDYWPGLTYEQVYTRARAYIRLCIYIYIPFHTKTELLTCKIQS